MNCVVPFATRTITRPRLAVLTLRKMPSRIFIDLSVLPPISAASYTGRVHRVRNISFPQKRLAA
jgi:hypothetical protein